MLKLDLIRKRNGTLVPFDSSKISNVAQKAFFNVTGNEHAEVAEEIKLFVMKKLEEIYRDEESGVPYVEQIQDLVEQGIMEAGYFDVAKHFILYRHEKIRQRAEQRKLELEKIEEGQAIIINRNGKQERFDEKLLRKFISQVVQGYEKDVSVEAIVARVKMEIYDGISNDDFLKAVVLSARSMVENDPAYSYVAARLVRYNIFKEAGLPINHDNFTPANISKIYQDFFKASVVEAVADKIYDERMATFNLDKLASALRPFFPSPHQSLRLVLAISRTLFRS